MHKLDQFYIAGRWVAPLGESRAFDIVDPSTEQSIGQVTLGSAIDADRAVQAAYAAFPAWSQSTREERIALLERIVALYKARLGDIAQAISSEMGAPIWLSREAQATAGLGQLANALAALKEYEFETVRGGTRIVREPVGVAALITPWNWPMNQIAAKVAPALAAGCTMVLKPSEIAPLDAQIFAEILHDAGVPEGVFNMVYGDGPGVGNALSGHPLVDMVSFTGSTRAGVQVAINASPGVKRVAQELGGKSANIILDDADLQKAVSGGVMGCMLNSGQSCNAPTRMLVPRPLYAQAVEIARTAAAAITVGDPRAETSRIGPLSCRAQFDKVQGLIAIGIEEGARVVAGGPGRPDGLPKGFYVRPTVFADVSNSMRIAREEIFGPVLVMIPYEGEDEAVAIANDTDYGLSGYVWSKDIARARRVARRLRTGNVHINGARSDFTAPFGGYKKSGNGRECGVYGLTEFLEYKAMIGYEA